MADCLQYIVLEDRVTSHIYKIPLSVCLGQNLVS